MSYDDEFDTPYTKDGRTPLMSDAQARRAALSAPPEAPTRQRPGPIAGPPRIGPQQLAVRIPWRGLRSCGG